MLQLPATISLLGWSASVVVWSRLLAQIQQSSALPLSWCVTLLGIATLTARLVRSLRQVLNAFSRMGASVLTWIPPARSGHFSDQVGCLGYNSNPQAHMPVHAASHPNSRGIMPGG